MDKSPKKRKTTPAKRSVVTRASRPAARKNTAGTLVLQWLTYAFWGGYGLAILWLSAVVFNFFLVGDMTSNWEEAVAYPLAAVIVLYLISMLTDYSYAQREPDEKHGIATGIMLVYTVLYALASIIALVVVVFALIRMLIGADSIEAADGPRVMLYTALTVAAVYGLISARAIFAGRMRYLRKLFWTLMSLVGIGFIVLAIMGPAVQANLTKRDRLIEGALPALASQIQDYTAKNDKLPNTLTDVEYSKQTTYKSDEVQKMISEKLVRYTPNTKPMVTGDELETINSKAEATKYGVEPGYFTPRGQKTYFYKLCVDYQHEKKSTTNYKDMAYTYGVNTSDHGKGEVCYDLSATGKYN